MQPILVVLDPVIDAPQPALEKAAKLARASDAPLALYINAYRASVLRAIGADDQVLAATTGKLLGAWEDRLRHLLEQLDAPDAESHLFFEPDDEHTLAKLTLSLKPALMVVHTEQLPGLARLAFTPRHWALVRKAPCPVLCVAPTPWGDRPQITVAVDTEHSRGKPESLDNRLVDQGRHLMQQLDGSVQLVNVVEYPDETLVMLAGDALPVSLSSTESLRDFYRSRLDEFCQENRFPEENARLLEGAPHKALAAHMSEHPGILVLGTIARGPVRRLLLGSTAEQVLQHTESDVLVVKPADFVSPWLEA